MTTTLSRWHPFTDLVEVRERLDRVFEDVTDAGRHTWAPRIDVVEEEDSLILRADLPGITPDEVDINIEDDVLTVSGEHEERSEEENKRFVRRERRYGSFSRSIALPKGIKADDIEATCEDGVVEVKVPRPAEPESKAVHIKPRSKEA